MLNPDTVKLEALEDALAKYADSLAERGVITHRQAACVFVGIDETTAFIPGEHEPEYDPYDDKPDWLLVMERDMADRMAALENLMALFRDMAEAELVDWFEDAEDRYECELIEAAERRVGA